MTENNSSEKRTTDNDWIFIWGGCC